LRAFGAGVLYAASAAIVLLAYHAVLHGRSNAVLMLGLPLALLLAAGAFGVDLLSWLSTGLRPTQSGYAAIVYMIIAYQGFHLAVLLVMALYALARCWRGLVAPDRLVTIENIGLFWLYACAQGATGLLVAHLAPRLL
jgi:cytochrome c oxidase subunit I+III